jgi:hypothetical protein
LDGAHGNWCRRRRIFTRSLAEQSPRNTIGDEPI